MPENFYKKVTILPIFLNIKLYILDILKDLPFAV